jgi:beta-N-acetylhexosaminidase
MKEIGQQLIIGLRGLALEKDEADFIVQNNIGGIILFKRNIQDPAQLRTLVSDVQTLRHKMPDKAPLFISIDMEGGRVHRVPPPFTQWPPVREIGKIDSTSVAFKFASDMGAELKAVGINLDFAPSVDVLTNPKNTVIGDRSLSSDPEQVAKLASALVRGYIKSGVIPCAKHFPGHGNTLLDSHEALPIEDKTLTELEQMELVPFKKVFRARLDLVMSSHLLFPKIDPDWPVTLSKIFLTDILRTQLRYRQLVITDDLGMKALTNKYDTKTIAVRALQAGANILLYCNEPDAPPLALEAIAEALKNKSLDSKVVSENHKRILEIKKENITQPDPLAMEEVSQIVGHPEHLRLAKAIIAGSVPADLLTT